MHRLIVIVGIALVGHFTGVLYDQTFLRYFFTAVGGMCLGGYLVHQAHLLTNRSRTEILNADGVSASFNREFAARR